MAVDFSILQRTPTIGSRIMAGQQMAREQALQNRLLARQDLQFQQQQEDRARGLEAERAGTARRQQLAQLLQQSNMDPTDLKSAQQFYSVALQTNEPNAIKAAQDWVKMASEAQQKRQQTEATRAEMASIFGPQAGAAPAAAAPGMGMPPVTSTLIDEGAARPEARVPMSIEGGAQAMPVQPQGAVTTRDISTGNALAPAAPAAAPQNRLITREQVQRGLMSTDPAVRAAAAAMTRTLPPEARPEKPESPYINVGGALYERATGRWLQPPSVRGEPTPRAPALTEVQDPTNPDRILRVDANVYRSGGPNSPGVIGVSGKSAAAAAKAKKVEEGQAQAQDIIDTLRGAYARLNDLNAVPSTQRGVLSNAFAYIAGTAPGQIAGRMAGTEEQVERDVIGSARNQVLNAVKNATGMSAQQLNSNVEFMSWLKSLTDPTVSYEANQRILDNLEKFIASGGKYSERKASGSVTPAAPAQRGAVGSEAAPKRREIAPGVFVTERP